MALVLMAKSFTLKDTTPTNNNQRSSSNPSNMQMAQPDMNMDQDKQMLMVEDNNVRNQNGLSVDPRIANQYRIGNVVTARAEGNGAYDELEKVNTNSTLLEKLQQASTSGTQTDSAPV
nr:hypothetical protein [Tanacetum cinerariifolium]GEV30299.1 hypothetical protein [Tanacetum cinerariifolium]